jgi:hypothetical protein
MNALKEKEAEKLLNFENQIILTVTICCPFYMQRKMTNYFPVFQIDKSQGMIKTRNYTC